MTKRETERTPSEGDLGVQDACGPTYEIRVAGRLTPRWSAWFDGLTVEPRADGTTALRGALVDQTALHGVIQRLRDLGLPLIAINQIRPTNDAERSARAEPQEQ